MKLDATPKRTDEELQPVSSFLNPYAPIRQHRRRLPHWQQGSVYYFVTWRLADSLPREKLARWNEAKKLWLDKNPPPWDSRTQVEYDEKFSQTIDDWLDAGKGSCILADPQLARCVADGLLHYHDKRYVMDSFIVMPNHVHTLFRLIEPHRLETVVKSWKGFTARAINRCLNKHGSLWQEDYWDRMIRDESHFLQCRDYIHANPNKARLNPSQFIFFVRETEGGFSNPPLTADRNVRPPKED